MEADGQTMVAKVIFVNHNDKSEYLQNKNGTITSPCLKE